MAAGERALGPRAFKDDVGHFWGILETRPYMRARRGLAQCRWEAGQHEEAVAHRRDLLRLNPGDNQGIRYVLAASLLELGRDDELATLLAEPRDDEAAAWTCTGALLAFRVGGDGAKARALLAAARVVNPFVPAYLLGTKRMPQRLPDDVGVGDDSESVAYVGAYAVGWQNTPGALAWLKAHPR